MPLQYPENLTIGLSRGQVDTGGSGAARPLGSNPAEGIDVRLLRLLCIS